MLGAGELVETLLPEGTVLDGRPGGFDEDAAEVAATLFGDMAGVVGLAGTVDSRAEAGIGNELL